VKYSPNGGIVEVGLELLTKGVPTPGADDAPRLPTAWALVSVRDEGIGVSQGQRRLIFDKFYRGDAPAVRRVAGTGLGLYICRTIVEAHGGHIWVESEQGKGSTFYVALPQE
jgi:signal transduction histidine kinase